MKIFRFLLVAALLAGCNAGQFTANTTASYKLVNGSPEVFYSSNKDQQGFQAKVVVDDNGKPKEFNVSTSANTPEAAIAAAAQAQAAATKALTDVLGALLPLVQSAVQGAAVGGAPGAAAAAAAKLAQERAAQGGANATSGQTAPAPAAR